MGKDVMGRAETRRDATRNDDMRWFEIIGGVMIRMMRSEYWHIIDI